MSFWRSILFLGLCLSSLLYTVRAVEQNGLIVDIDLLREEVREIYTRKSAFESGSQDGYINWDCFCILPEPGLEWSGYRPNLDTDSYLSLLLLKSCRHRSWFFKDSDELALMGPLFLEKMSHAGSRPYSIDLFDYSGAMFYSRFYQYINTLRTFSLYLQNGREFDSSFQSTLFLCNPAALHMDPTNLPICPGSENSSNVRALDEPQSGFDPNLNYQDACVSDNIGYKSDPNIPDHDQELVPSTEPEQAKKRAKLTDPNRPDTMPASRPLIQPKNRSKAKLAKEVESIYLSKFIREATTANGKICFDNVVCVQDTVGKCICYEKLNFEKLTSTQLKNLKALRYRSWVFSDTSDRDANLLAFKNIICKSPPEDAREVDGTFDAAGYAAYLDFASHMRKNFSSLVNVIQSESYANLYASSTPASRKNITKHFLHKASVETGVNQTTVPWELAYFNGPLHFNYVPEHYFEVNDNILPWLESMSHRIWFFESLEAFHKYSQLFHSMMDKADPLPGNPNQLDESGLAVYLEFASIMGIDSKTKDQAHTEKPSVPTTARKQRK